MPRQRRQGRSRDRTTHAARNPAYLRTTITIPRELKARMEGMGSRVNWSAVASEAFESKVSKLEVEEQPMPELPDKDDALERLRRLKNEPESRRRAESSHAYVLGKHWAMADAHPNELRRLEEYCRSNVLKSMPEDSKTQFGDRRAVKELYRDLTLSILGYTYHPSSIDQARLFPADIEEVRHQMKPFWEQRVGVVLDIKHGHGREFLSEFTKGALDFWEEAKEQL